MNNKIYKLLNGNILPEITVVPTRLSLSTYYPIIGKNYRYTGHSSLSARSPEYTVDTSDGFTTVPAKHARINKRSSDVGYNFITNNCADATRCALESITGKKMNPYFFTTPGDVLDFFKENFDDVRRVKSKNSGKEVYYTNITPKQLEMIKEQLLELILKNRKERHKELLANARKWKHEKGGKAFVTGVNVLDSNPKAYKYVKKKYKMHLYGGEIINESPIVTSRLNWIQSMSDYLQKKKELDLLKKELDLLKKQLQSDMISNIGGMISNYLPDIISSFGKKKSNNNSFNSIGTINSNGSMNTGIGGLTYNWNTDTFGSNNIMNGFNKISLT